MAHSNEERWVPLKDLSAPDIIAEFESVQGQIHNEHYRATGIKTRSNKRTY